MWSYFKLIAWGTGWFFVWGVTYPFRHGRHNCLTWAVDKWDHDGGYLVIRWCRHNKINWIRWPHFLWLDPQYHIYLEHVIPEHEDEEHYLPSPWFDPVNKIGDPEDVVEN